jgi:hypothetical protein
MARWAGNISQSLPKKLAINNVRVFDGYRLLDPATVVIDGGLIGVDPTGAENIDGAGGVLLPGLLDSHCHPENITHLKDLSRFGVTTGLIAAFFRMSLHFSSESSWTARCPTGKLPRNSARWCYCECEFHSQSRPERRKPHSQRKPSGPMGWTSSRNWCRLHQVSFRDPGRL